MALKKILTISFLSVFVFGVISTLPTEALAQKKFDKKARKRVREGDKLFSKRRYQEAIQKYNEAIERAPDYPKAHYGKGYSYLRLGQAGTAVESLNRASELGYEELKIVSVRMEAHYLNKDFDSAINDANAAIRLQPEVGYYYTFLGRLKILKENYDGALSTLARARELGDNSADLVYLLAVASAGANKIEDQEKYADEALKRGVSSSGHAWFLLGEAQFKAKKYAAAEKSYVQAINAHETTIANGKEDDFVNENLFQSYSDLADVYRNLNRFDEAVKSAKSALGKKQGDGAMLIRMTWYYSLAGRIGDAVITGQKAVQAAPGQYAAHTNLCRAYNDQGELLYRDEKQRDRAKTSFNQAIASCKKALELEPNDGETNYYVGRAYFYLDRNTLSNRYYKKSVPGLEKFTSENPDYSDGFYLLGNAYFATQQKKKAIEAYLTCLQITPRFARVRYNLGFVYVQDGNLDKAKEQQEVLKTLDEDLANRLAQVISGE